jgi:hypothetical protein
MKQRLFRIVVIGLLLFFAAFEFSKYLYKLGLAG